MNVEHFALNVADPAAMAAWYEQHLGCRIVRHGGPPAHAHFVADTGGNVMLEIYRNPPDQVPDYRAMIPLLLHVAFVSEDPAADKARLLAAGASPAEEARLPDGSHIVTLRDPWGLCIQLCKRGTPLLARATPA